MKSSITTKLIAVIAVILLLTVTLCSCGNDDLQKQIDDVKNAATNAQTAADNAKTAAGEAKALAEANGAAISAASQAAQKLMADAKAELEAAVKQANDAIKTMAPLTAVTEARTALETAIQNAEAAANAAIAASAAEIQGKLDEAAGIQAELAAQIAANAEADAATKKSLEEALAACEAACEALINEKLVDVKALVGKAVTTEAFNEKVAELAGLIGDNANEISSIKTDYTTLVKLSETIADLKAYTDNATVLLKDVTENVQDQIDAILSKLGTDEGNIAALQGQVKALEDANKAYKDAINAVAENLSAIAAKMESVKTYIYTDGKNADLTDAYYLAFAAALRATTADEAAAAKTEFFKVFDSTEDDYVENKVDMLKAMIEDIYDDDAFTIDENADAEAIFQFLAAEIGLFNPVDESITIDAKYPELTALMAEAYDESSTIKEKFVELYNDYVTANGAFATFAAGIEAELYAFYADNAVSEDDILAAEALEDELKTAFATNPEYEAALAGYTNTHATEWSTANLAALLDAAFDAKETSKTAAETAVAALAKAIYAIGDIDITKEDEIEDAEALVPAIYNALGTPVWTVSEYRYNLACDYTAADLEFVTDSDTDYANENLITAIGVARATWEALDGKLGGYIKAYALLVDTAKTLADTDMSTDAFINAVDAIDDYYADYIATIDVTEDKDFVDDAIEDFSNADIAPASLVNTFANVDLPALAAEYRAKYYVANYALLVDAARTAAEASKTDISETGLIALVEAAEGYYTDVIAALDDDVKADVLDGIEDFSNADISTALDNTYENDNLPDLLAGYRTKYETLYENFQAFAAGFTDAIEEIGTVDDVTLADGTALLNAFEGYVYWQSNVTNIDTLDIPVGTLDPQQPVSYYVTLYNSMLMKYAALKAEYQARALAFIAAVGTIESTATPAGAEEYDYILAAGTLLAASAEDRDYFTDTVVDPEFGLDDTTPYSALTDALTAYNNAEVAYEDAIDELADLIDAFNTDLDAIYEDGLALDDAAALEALVDNYAAALQFAYDNMDPAIVEVDDDTTIDIAAELAKLNDVCDEFGDIEGLLNTLLNAMEAFEDKIEESYNGVNDTGTRYFSVTWGVWNNTDKALVEAMINAFEAFDGIEDGNVTGTDAEGEDITIKDDYEALLVKAAKIESILVAQKAANTFRNSLPAGKFKNYIRPYLENALFTQTQAIMSTTITDTDEILAMGAASKINEILEKVYFEELNAQAPELLDAYLDAALANPTSTATTKARAKIDAFLDFATISAAEDGGAAFMSKVDSAVLTKYFKVGAMVNTIDYYNSYLAALELVNDADIKSVEVKGAMEVLLIGYLTIINNSDSAVMEDYLALCDTTALKGVICGPASTVYWGKVETWAQECKVCEDVDFDTAYTIMTSYISANWNAELFGVDDLVAALIAQADARNEQLNGN